MLEFTNSLLRHFLGFKFSIIDELARGVDWLVLRLRLVWDILHSTKVNLQRVQFLAEVGRKQRHISLNVNFQVVELLRFQTVETPVELKALVIAYTYIDFGGEKKARKIKLNCFDYLVILVNSQVEHCVLKS